jgi:heavy metal sensor kinase
MNPSIGDRRTIADRVEPKANPMQRAVAWLDRQTAARHEIPIRGRIALFTSAVVAITVVIFGLAVYYLVEGNLVAQQTTTLRQRGDQVWAFLEEGPRFARLTSPFPEVDINRSTEIFVQVFNAEQASQGSSGYINGIDPQWPSSTFSGVAADHAVIREARPIDGPEVRAYIRAIVGSDGTIAEYMIVGQPTAVVDDQLGDLRAFLITGILLSLLAAAALSWLLAGRALRPLVTMAATAEDIGRTQDLSRRLPTVPADDEVGRLQRSFNQMLRQLEDAYLRLRTALNTQRRFVADASHELRTPLTTIRGNVGLLLKRDDITNEDKAAALEDIASESERMSRMVQDLLTLARADAGYHLEKYPLDLRPIVEDVSRQAQKLQPTRRVELQDGQPAIVTGNADALKQLLWILIDNAFKHTAENGHVKVQLEPGSSWTTLVVSDNGPGIPPSDLERIFERFYQSDTSRSGEGTGLGLAIARWIAREHGGKVSASNNPEGGARFTVQLPLAPKS